MNGGVFLSIAPDVITSYAIIFSGLLTLFLSFVLKRSTWRWRSVYLIWMLGGIIILWHHAMPDVFWLWFADIGAALIVVWAIQLAFVKDFYEKGKKIRFKLPLITGISVIFTFAVLTIFGLDLIGNNILSFDRALHYYLAVTVIVCNALVAIVLFYLNRKNVSKTGDVLMSIVIGIFFLGMIVASLNELNLFGFHYYHALWHLIAAFGFILLWVYTDIKEIKK